MMHVTLWPNGLIGRVIAVILIAIGLEFAGSLVLHGQVDRYTQREDHARRVAELLVVGDRLLRTAPAAEQTAVLESLSTEHLSVSVADKPVAEAARADPQLTGLRAQIVRWEPSLKDKVLRLATVPSAVGKGHQDLIGSLRLDNTRWLDFRSRDVLTHWPQLYRTLVAATILAAGVLLATAILISTLGAPLRNLARAADQLGHGQPVMVVERGPRDLKQVSQAFNALQSRINGLIASRTQALAAVGHDLRTPLTRLRLRSGLMPDGDARTAMEADIDEMERMLDSVLAYLKGDGDSEPPRMIDLSALLSTLVDNDADLGRPVTFDGPDHLLIESRPLALKRAVGNLVENGLKYGAKVHVRLARLRDEAQIVVEDEGPGIPEDQLPHVTAPFYRLDEARARDTGGLGLGLAVVAQVIEREGGTLRLSNRPEGGLRAEVRLPLPETA